MQRNSSTLVATAALLLITSIFTPQLAQSQGNAGTATVQDNDLAYSCPMHPEVKSKTPGSCPKCGMTLTAVHHARASSASTSRWGANYFPNVPLTTQDGVTVHFYDDLLKGKIVAINLIYTHCKDLCPLETARLAQVQRILGDRIGKDIFFYSITIDPKQDTPSVLKAYAEKFHAGPGWLFLTGKEEDIELISKKLGLYTEPNPANRDGHAPSLLLGNEATGQWMRNAALDNPRFLAILIGDWLNSWQNAKRVAGKNYAEAPAISIKSTGQYLFGRQCAACHTLGHGDSIGPDLQGVSSRRDRAWLTRFIKAPDEMLAQKDPIATALFNAYKQVRMPNLRLGDEDTNALVEYLEAQNAAPSGNIGDKPAGALSRKP